MEHTLNNEKVKIVVSDVGAELVSLVCGGREYLWGGDPVYWKDHSPVLFPYVGRFTRGKYSLHGREYEMNIHGFARHEKFDLVENKDNLLHFELSESDSTLKAYPYRFTLGIKYELTGNTLNITYLVDNKSEDVMYFGIGGHPGFYLPLCDGLDFSDYYLEFEGKSAPDRVGFSAACFVNGENKPYKLVDDCKIVLSHDMFDDDAIVLQNMSHTVTLKSDKDKHFVRVSYPDMPYLGLWHAPKTEAPYICIEPWASLPSRQDVVEEFSSKSDLVRLKSGCRYNNGFSISVE